MSDKNLFLIILLIITFKDPVCGQDKISCTIYFESNMDTITQEEKTKLQTFVKSLDTIPNYFISVKGYCDDIGSSEYNMILSKKRALSVREELIGLGIKSSLKIKTTGMGEHPVSDESEKEINEQRKNNRKAEISFVKENKELIVKNNEIKQNIISDDLKVGDKIALKGILFKSGYAILLPGSYAAVDQLIIELKKNTKFHIAILGHICCMPPGMEGIDQRTGQRDLSLVRARIVYYYLINHGIDASRLTYKGLKHDYPTGKGNRHDMRVEIEITAIDK